MGLSITVLIELEENLEGESMSMFKSSSDEAANEGFGVVVTCRVDDDELAFAACELSLISTEVRFAVKGDMGEDAASMVL